MWFEGLRHGAYGTFYCVESIGVTNSSDWHLWMDGAWEVHVP